MIAPNYDLGDLCGASDFFASHYESTSFDCDEFAAKKLAEPQPPIHFNCSCEFPNPEFLEFLLEDPTKKYGTVQAFIDAALAMGISYEALDLDAIKQAFGVYDHEVDDDESDDAPLN